MSLRSCIIIKINEAATRHDEIERPGAFHAQNKDSGRLPKVCIHNATASDALFHLARSSLTTERIGS